MYPAYQQPAKYNPAVACNVLKHIYTAKRPQPPTSLGVVFDIRYVRDTVCLRTHARFGV